jgi:hypothetical protein
MQIKTFLPEVMPQDKWIPDNVDISKKLSKYNEKIYFLDDFFPIAVFYSNKKINSISQISTSFDQKDKFVVLVRNWVTEDLDKQKINYEVLEKNGTFSIITKSK